VYERINEMNGLKCQLPKGAFYVFPSVKCLGMSSEQLAEALVREAGVLAVPGSAFGPCGEGYLRVSYAAAYEKLEEAMNRIEKVIKGFG
jgi:aminotransferase